MQSDKQLQIAIIADPYIPVPPRLYGGIERIISFLVEGLVAKGHNVILLAASGSTVPCELIPYGDPPHDKLRSRLSELWQVMNLLSKRSSDLDIVHSFGRLAGLIPLFFSDIPKVQSYQRAINRRNVIWATRLSRSSVYFTACSTSCRREVSKIGNWRTVYNGVKLSDYTLHEDVTNDAALVFLGRIEPIKGTHAAIQIALRTGRRLIIAGNIPSSSEAKRYFLEEVEPYIDGDQISYIGPIDDVAKNELLGSAQALLMPIFWEEPFGIVMAEALACGTPVIGMRRGAVPEVVEDSITGFVCDTLEEMIQAVAKLPNINRRSCRIRCERLFSSEVIVDAYENLYKDAITKVNA